MLRGMTYNMPDDLYARLQDHLAAGSYESESEVLHHAMDALEQVEQDRLLRWNERNRSATLESQQGLSRPLDQQAVFERLRARLAADGIL